MKRMFGQVALLLATFMLLSACTGQPENPGTTGGTTTVPTQETTVATEPETTPPTETKEKTPAELSTAEDFREFINNNQWYRRALGCVFEKPEALPTRFYFYGGVGDNAQETEEEREFIINAYKEKNPKQESLDYALNYVRLPVSKMNEALTILGVTIEDIQIPDNWAYNEKLDCYYFWASDAYMVSGWSVTEVEKGTEGIVAIYWKMDGVDNGKPSTEIPSRGANMVLTMQLTQDGTYQVLSNVPQA